MPHTTLLDAIRRWEPPTPEALAGQIAGYDVVRFLARGGMAAVYEGRQISLDRPVALKVLPPELGREPGFQERFEGEARLLGRLSSAGVVQVIDFGKTEAGSAFIVMELIEGSPMHVWAPGRGAPEKFAVALKLLETVAACHDQGVVHADLKPENVFVQADGSIKLVDFGLATQIGGEVAGTEGPRFGTPPYTAPEAYYAGANPTRQSDVYSLAQTLVLLFAGTHASLHPRLDELESLLGRGDLAAVMEPMFRPRPEDRPASVQDVLARLRKLPMAPAASGPVSRRDMRKAPRKPAATPAAPVPPAAAAPISPRVGPATTRSGPRPSVPSGVAQRRAASGAARLSKPDRRGNEIIIASVTIAVAIGLVIWFAMANQARKESQTKKPAPTQAP